MHTQSVEGSGNCRIVRCTQSAVAKSAQVLAREEAEASNCAKTPGPTTLVLGSDGLCRVFDHRYLPLGRKITDRIHIGESAKQVNWQNGLRVWMLPECRIGLADIHVERSLIDIDKDGGGAGEVN